MGIKQKTIKTIKVFANKNSCGRRIEPLTNPCYTSKQYFIDLAWVMNEENLHEENLHEEKPYTVASEKMKIVRNIFISYGF
ncbi:TPA: hypothetical protein QC285_005173 [Bacillus cereus]|uniref:hypothetical protein n=1 Tax=Bacillus cereus TaxID=1396 RepID=UPI000BEBC85E|nr:hypothetical protein [Bacillus cereus]RGP99807.1 hypothetical protein D1166_12740 [Bacillus sp. ISO11]PEC99400.1 hypothetical protein CON14_29365 [Bacillus cereus]PEQ26544.1 hypothetical protein CN466_30615 [Bacillus cereus]PER59667.1 hypothetical protein CN503_26215 [Bacillus cereus]PEV64322.1 hypothetical protein CN423_15575 [Bacillus cereus]